MAILKIAKLPIRKTHLMSEVGLSYVQVQKYLDLMTKNGLIENLRTKRRMHDKILFKTTEKGCNFITKLELAEKLW